MAPEPDAAPDPDAAATQRAISGRGFSDVDHAGDPGHFVRYLDTVSATDWVRAYKRRALELLAPAPGHHVLDVGCGTGEDAREIAARVAPDGRVVGIDTSELMVGEARARTHGDLTNVEFRTGDVLDLRFDDGAFDRVRADRVLQHVREPARALAGMARVTRAGGRVLVADTDWGVLLVDAPDRALTRKVTTFICDAVSSSWIGRQLPRLFRDAGLEDIAIAGALNTFTDADAAAEVLWLRGGAEQAHRKGVLSDDEAARWLAFLDDASSTGRFFAASGGFLVAGRKP